MKNLSQIIKGLVSNCLERYCEEINTNTSLYIRSTDLTKSLQNLIDESYRGIELSNNMIQYFSREQQELIMEFNKHGSLISQLVKTSYEAIKNIKPYLWFMDPELFEKLSVALHAKALTTYRCFRYSYSSNTFVSPITDVNSYSSSFINLLLHVSKNDNGDLLLGVPLKR